MDKILQDMLLAITKSIDFLIKDRFKNLSFDYTEKGTVSKILPNNTYGVIINGSESILKAREGLKLSLNDIVLIRVIKGNYSDRFIDCKKP